MKRAFELAWKGLGRNSPNPLVGCVIVRDGVIVGEGTHFFEKVSHAETIALAKAAEKAKGATVYINLEPCCHTGRTPPCTDALIKAGVARVVYSIKDPDGRVNGCGHEILEKAGIKCESGLMADEAREINRFFLAVHEKNRPFVLLKWAMTADGKIATRSGASRWISNDESRNIGNHLRNIFDAILVGHTTVITDNPKLTCRVDLSHPLPEEIFPYYPRDIRNPKRVVLDTFGAICHHDLNLFENPGTTIIAIGPESEWDDVRARDSLDGDKIELLVCPLKAGYIDLEFLLEKLMEKGINSVLVEGGSGVHASFLEKDLADEVTIAIGPKIFGGEAAQSPVGGLGAELVDDAVKLTNIKNLRVGDDLMIFGKIEK